SPRQRVRPVAASLGRRQRDGRRLVRVPDVDRVRPDADDRRARDPGGARAGRLAAIALRPAGAGLTRSGPAMRFGTYHTFQCPPGRDPAQVVTRELERAV